MEISRDTMVPFDKQIFASRLKFRKISRNDLLNHPSVTFTKNQLNYYEKMGTIPKPLYDEIEMALSDTEFRIAKNYKGHRYVGNLVDFGPSEYFEIKKQCKNLNVSLVNLCSLERISYETIRKYKKERQIPNDLLEKIHRGLAAMAKENVEELQNEKVVDIESVKEPSQNTTPNTEVFANDCFKIADTLKLIIKCNGEANLNLCGIENRYNCDLETFVNSVFSLISNDGYVIFTTYNNGKPVFSLGEPM